MKINEHLYLHLYYVMKRGLVGLGGKGLGDLGGLGGLGALRAMGPEGSWGPFESEVHMGRGGCGAWVVWILMF